ncbi:MAG: pullulanase [Clostridiales bacterium]|nr:pullulanase [Clostridiales bacterium]
MKRLSRILLVLVLVLSLLPLSVPAAEAVDQLAVHYQNEDNNYEDLGIWFWGDVATASEKTGAWPDGRTLFEQVDEDAASLVIDLAPEAREVGVLVIDGQGTKLTPEDLMIELASPRMRQVWINNQLEVFFENQRAIPENHLRVRFFRETEDYQDMGVWFWGDVVTASEKTGGWPVGATPVTPEEGPLGAYVDIELAEGAQEVGFLFVNRATGEQTEDFKFELDGQTRVIYMKEGDDTIRRNPYKTEAAPPEAARDIIPWQQKDAEFFTTEALGATLHEDGSATLRLWAPTADQVEVVLYAKNRQDLVIRDGLKMTRGERGVWEIRLDGKNTPLSDLEGAFYHFRVTRGAASRLVLDPYARSMAAWNSQNQEGHLVGKAAIVAPERIGPALSFAQIEGFVDREDAIIYELHVRDFTVSPFLDGKLEAPFGTFKALMERLNYLKHLGVTHIQLLPVLNYYHVDELDRSRNMDYAAEQQNYNWGYDPHSYFALTGMYATDPKDPKVRIQEFKELVAAIHDRGMGVILDVVYNHTAKIELLEDIEPDYYYFMDKNGKPKGSFGGGQVGSTHLMTRRLIVDSLVYLTDTYKVDGFRFDMMGNLDLDTILEAHEAVSAINPATLWIGEGWRTWNGDAGVTGIIPADQDAMDQTDAVAVFSDEVRNELKSGFGSEGQPRFLTGGKRPVRVLFDNVKAQPGNVQEDDPGDIVQYIAAHDNLTLHDVIAHSIKKDPALHEEEILQRLRLGNAMLLTHQGIIFLHSGQEYGRTKQFKHPDYEGRVETPPAKSTFMTDENGVPFQYPYFIHDSYDASDAVNMFDWEKVETSAIHRRTRNYMAGLIALRRSTDAFSYADMADIDDLVQRITLKEEQAADLVLAYTATSKKTGDVYVVAFNADNVERSLDLSEQPLTAGAVHVLVDAEKAGAAGIKEPVGVAVQMADGQLTGITLAPLTATVVLLINP